MDCINFSQVILKFGLVGSLLLTGTSAGLAQTNNGSDATNPGQTDSSMSGLSDITNLGQTDSSMSGLSDITNLGQTDSSMSGLRLPQKGSTAIDDVEGETVTVTTLSGGTVTVSEVDYSRGMVNVLSNLSPTAVTAILNALGISSSLPLESGQLVASTTGVQLAQSTESSDQEDVMNLFNAFNTAFMKAGVERERAASNAENLVLALANMKTWFRSDGRINLGAVNKTTRLMKPVLESVPELRQVLQNNPSTNDYSLVLNTTTAIETVLFPLQAINNAI